MKKILIGWTVFLGFSVMAHAATVNPASNVTADSDNTAGTIVYRHPSTGVIDVTLSAGNVDTAKIANGSINTDKIAPGAINTNKLGLGLVPHAGQILCVKTGNPGAIGYCADGATFAGGQCSSCL